ncbi:MAG: 4'-phosphopantetheinyl transferase superfamily protein [Chitinophagaceae bacterium]|nr:4'-phosphopantetheinyl transferase superfamily protein [Chitinophagaceae bacterium]
MPMVYQQNINPHTKLGVWHIAEPESFFLNTVPLQREITHPHKRLQHLAGRFLLKELYPDFPYELIKIADTRKPFLENEAYHFSISHCGDYAAVMVSTGNRVGVDVELITAKVERIKHKFLSPFEQNIIEQLSGADTDSYKTFLTSAWSIKESLYKWFGDGEVDFIDHLHIEKIVLDDNSGAAYCKILKSGEQPLTVHFLLFNNNCISWVLTEI